MSQSTYPKPYKTLTIFVCIAAAVVGGLFGLFTYGITGLYVAGIGGIIAGHFWSYRMLLCTRKGIQGGKLANRGIFWGIVVGMADGLLLHLVAPGVFAAPHVSFMPGNHEAIISLSNLFEGLVFGFFAGAFNGLIWGRIWNAVAKARPLTATSPE